VAGGAGGDAGEEKRAVKGDVGLSLLKINNNK
jgi:hypothetical protein